MICFNKTRLLILPCRLCFLMTFHFLFKATVLPCDLLLQQTEFVWTTLFGDHLRSIPLGFIQNPIICLNGSAKTLAAIYWEHYLFKLLVVSSVLQQLYDNVRIFKCSVVVLSFEVTLVTNRHLFLLTKHR